MNLRQKIGQLITIEIPDKQRLSEETAAFIRECHPASIAPFGQNLAGPWASAKLISEIQKLVAEAGDAPILIGIDQEGGQVSHLRYPCTEMPSNMARTAAGGAKAAGEAAAVLGSEMARLGLNLAYAPVLDVNTNPANPVIGTRAFSDDPAKVAACGVATIQALRQVGIFSMAKHFPGHGDANADSHLAVPIVGHSRQKLEAVELVPFRAAIAAGVDAICSAHIIYPELDDSGLPATLSRRLMTELLRAELGFKGVLFSDALVMEAISHGKSANIPPAAIKAIQAGVDNVMLLGRLEHQRHCYNALLRAVEDGEIAERRLDEAVERLQALRQRINTTMPIVAWPDREHQAVARRLAQDAVTLVRDEASLLPLYETDANGLQVISSEVGVIEFVFGSASPVESSRNEPLNVSTLALVLEDKLPGVRYLVLPASAPQASTTLHDFISGCHKIVVATRSAILDSAQAELLRQIAACGKPIIQLALRNPYDATIAPQISTVLLTYGDQPTAIIAAVNVLLGEGSAIGQLPIKLALQVNEQAKDVA